MAANKPAQWIPGILLQQAREDKGLSKNAAATKAGLSESRWRQLESGARYLNGVWVPAGAPAATLVKAARAVDLNPNELLVAAGKRVATDQNDLRQAVINNIDLLSQDQLRTVDGFIKALLLT